MSLIDYLQPLFKQRTDQQIVVPTMGAAREWMKLGTHPLDFIYAPSAMGQAPTLGLGLALAQPSKQVIVLNGDGCQLMNLGCFVTISAVQVSNLVMVICNNGAYEVTGNQATAASPSARPSETHVDFAAIARGCGWTSVFDFRTAEDWERALPNVMATPGPTCVIWHYPADPEGRVPKSPAPPFERGAALRNLLAPRRD